MNVKPEDVGFGVLELDGGEWLAGKIKTQERFCKVTFETDDGPTDRSVPVHRVLSITTCTRAMAIAIYRGQLPAETDIFRRSLLPSPELDAGDTALEDASED